MKKAIWLEWRPKGVCMSKSVQSLESREMHFKLSLMHFISIIHPTSLKHGEFGRSSACSRHTKKKTLFANSETQMVFVNKNIFIIKAGYNTKFQASVIDYKRWNSTPECVWRVCESERELELGPVVLWECSPSWLAGFLILSEVIWWNRQKHNSNHVMKQSPGGVTTASAQWTVCSAFTWELQLTHQLLIKE